MEWKPRTATKSGRYQKIILEETPSRVIMQGHETYDDLLAIGQEKFWPDCPESEFTLCHPDGSRWSKEDFMREHSTVAEMSAPWKRTLYVGRKELGKWLKVF